MATAGGWLKGCGIGCGLALVLTVVSFVGCGVTMMKPFKGAQADREILDERHGAQSEYRPAPDGSIDPRRLETFLAVRERVMDVCGEFDETAASLDSLDEMDDDASKTEAIRTVFGAMDDILAMPALMGRFAEVRNAALLEHDMGLGEYSYIYVTAYYSWLGKYGLDEGSSLDGRQRSALREMLRSQLEDLRAADPESDFIAVLDRELMNLESDDELIPWRDGPPPALLAVYEPHRERLEALWCANTSGFELFIHRTKGLSVHAN